MVKKMYEDLKGKKVKIVIKEGEEIKTLRGIFLNSEDTTLKIEIGKKINYFEKQYIIRIRLDEEI